MKVGALWFPWFGFDSTTGASDGGPGSFHWDALVVEPEKGLYASDDPDVIAWQIGLLREAGIDWALLSWWGIGDSDYDDVVDDLPLAGVHRANKAILSQIQTLGGAIKASIIVEPWPAPGPFLPVVPLTAEQKAKIWDWIRDELYTPYSDVWLEWEGKPLVTAWLPMDIGEDPLAQFTYKVMSVAVPPVQGEMADVMNWNALTTVDDDEFVEAVSDTRFGIVMPRFDNYQVYVRGNVATPTRIDPWLRQGWQDRNWEMFFKHRDIVDLCLVWSLNDYGEQTYFEPTITPPPIGSGRLLFEKTKYYVHLLKTGESYKRYGESVADATDLRHIIGDADTSEVAFENEAELETFLADLVRRAQAHVEVYLNDELAPFREEASISLYDVAVDETQMTVAVPDSFSMGDLVQIGLDGDAEFAVVSDVTGKVLTFTAGLKNSHARQTAVVKIEPPVYSSLVKEASPAIQEVVLRLAANLWSYMLKTRRGPLVQTGEFNVEVNDDRVFTRAIKEDLRSLRARPPLGVVR